MLKGVLEADSEVELIAGSSRTSFAPLFEVGGEDDVSSLIAQHGTALLATPAAARAVTLAAHSALSGHRSFALVPNDELDLVMPSLRDARQMVLAGGGAMCAVLEDDPDGSPAACPRQAAMRLDMPCLEPADVDQLRHAMENALRLSQATRCPVAMVVHRWILRSAETLEARPNRVLDQVTAAVVRPRRRARWAEAGDVLRVVRRLELNRLQSVPSPGELLPVGFIVVGPAAGAINHVVHVLRLTGRVPILQLGLLHPIDESLVQRLLGRCQEVIVLEPRPGSIAAVVLRAAEAMRRSGEHTAAVSTHAVGDDKDESRRSLHADEALHPSILARKIVPLLHAIRPGLELPFVPDPPALAVVPPPRGENLGDAGALARVRQILADVDQWLHDRAATEPSPQEDVEEEEPATALAIDGAEPQGAVGQRVVTVETWPYRRFLDEGIASLRQAAWDDRPWLFVVCALEAGDVHDVERLARAAIPAQRSEGVRIEAADLNDRGRLRDLLRHLTPSARLSVVIVRDGPPPRFDVAALEETRAEIDRLGYEPRQRLVQSAEAACAVRESLDTTRLQPLLEAGARPLRTQFNVGRLSRSRRTNHPVRLRVRPLLEAVEVLRDRPPASRWRSSAAGRLELPRPIHATEGRWRAHLAGFRGHVPGVAGRALCEAGRVMGYHVHCLHDPTPIGPARRAWTEVLFTRSREDKGPVPITVRVPYGEADLLIGLDLQETLRAVDPAGVLRVANRDHTYLIANLGPFSDEDETSESPHLAAAALRAVSRDQPRVLEDFAAAARAIFHSDRVTDLTLLGVAFQRGLIPVSHEAIEAGVRRVEQRGYGRAMEAFRFGRHLAVEHRIFARPREGMSTAGNGHAAADDVDHLVRRILLLLRCGRWGGRLDVPQFGELIRGALESMPGLTETDPGREARRDLAVALHRCLLWGGYEYAKQYADLITSLYRHDRGDTGRALTRSAILPLAEAMLVRDPIFVATLVTSSVHRRRARRRLNIKLARGDRIQRRFLTRVEVAAFERRLRLDFRTSDWLAWAAAFTRHRIPHRWRGTAHEREIRDLVVNVIEQATDAGPAEYDRWSETLQRLHDQAADDRLRGMALSELRMLIEPETVPEPGLEPEIG